MSESIYTGYEPAIDLGRTGVVEPNEVFDARPPSIRNLNNATPIYDEQIGAIIGYRVELCTGVYRLYDLTGNYVGMEEKGLEQPLFDPIDLLMIGGSVLRSVARGAVGMGTRAAVSSGAKLTTRAVSSGMVASLRAVFRRVSVQSLKFTTKTTARMATKGRYVPIHILRLAIKYGKRTPDPQGVKGAFQYLIPMFKNGKKYILEVVVREKDWTILHFVYKLF